MEPNNRSRGLKWLTYEYPLVVVAMIFIWVWNSGYLIYFSFSNLIINKKNYCQTFREFRKNLGVGEKSFFRWSYESTPEFFWVCKLFLILGSNIRGRLGHLWNKPSQMSHLFGIFFIDIVLRKIRLLQKWSVRLRSQNLLLYCRKHCRLSHLRENHYYILRCNLH